MGDMSTKPAASSLNPEYADIVDTPSMREVTSREHKYCGHVLDVTVEKYLLSPHGPELTRDVVGMPGAVAVATLDEHDRILLLNQYRHPVRMNLWEVPAGLLDIEGEDPLAAAQRELAEEADLEAKTWHTLIDYYTTPGGADEAGRIYLARGLRRIPEGQRIPRGEEEAEITYRWVPLDAAVQLVLAGHIHNGLANQAIMAAYVASQAGFANLRSATDSWDFHPYLGGRRTRYRNVH